MAYSFKIDPKASPQERDRIRRLRQAGADIESNKSSIIQVSETTTVIQYEEKVTCLIEETISGGNWVNLFYDAGELKCRKATANSANPYRADGFIKTAHTYVSTPIEVEIYLAGKNNQFTGLTIGEKYFLSTTAGEMSLAAPTGAGEIHQLLGKSLSATELLFEKNHTILLN